MNIENGISVITESIKKSITTEMTEDGLLSDVEAFIPSYRIEDGFDDPCIWLVEHETTPVKDGSFSRRQLLQTPFEFVCIVYDSEDLEQSEILGKDLASRVVLTLLKNFNRITSSNSIQLSKPHLEALYPIGFHDINDAGDRVVATSVRINIQYYVDWNICCKKKLNEGE